MASQASGTKPIQTLDPVKLAKLDLASRREEFLFRLPLIVARPLSRLLQDPRDEPVLHLLCNLILCVWPAAALMFAYCRSHWVGVAYLALNYALFLQRYMLTLHVTEHRNLFKKGEHRAYEDRHGQCASGF